MASSLCTLLVAALVVATVLAVPHAADDPPPPACPKSTPSPAGHKACPLKAPSDPEFESICHPGATGHAGGAEQPVYRCPLVNYTDGVFRCACCGAPLFYAKAKYQPQGDGWPAFHGNTSNGALRRSFWGAPYGRLTHLSGQMCCAVNGTVCTPGGTEVVCSKCGSHLGDYFAAGVQSGESYYCIDGVCLLPPGAAAGKVCEPAPGAVDTTPTKAEAYKALRGLMRERGAEAVLGQIDDTIAHHEEQEGHEHDHHQ